MLQDDASSKAIIFSSFSRYLDILREHLEAAGMACARIDGSQTVQERDRQIRTFQDPAAAPVLLMSLKCGVGLNLTMASTVCVPGPRLDLSNVPLGPRRAPDPSLSAPFLWS